MLDYPGVSLNVLRRAFATYIEKSDMTPREKREKAILSGHTQSMAKQYAHSGKQDEKSDSD